MIETDQDSVINLIHDEHLIKDHNEKLSKTEKELEKIWKSVNRIESQLTLKKVVNGFKTKQIMNDIEGLKDEDKTIAEKVDSIQNDVSEIKGLLKGSDKLKEFSYKNRTTIIASIAVIVSILLPTILHFI